MKTDAHAFMANVRAALGRDTTVPPSQPPPVVDESIVRLASHDDDLLAMFQQRAEEVGMVVHRLSDTNLFETVKRVLGQFEARRVVTAMSDGADLCRDLTRVGFEVVDGRDAGFDVQFDIDAGVTDVQAALAETGTMICTSSCTHSRGPSLVPPLHIAIVRRRDIVADMIDYWQRLKGIASTDLPASMSFITGPSKTADIENILVTGVHGPKDVQVMLVQDT